MESSVSKWLPSFLYLASIAALIYFFHFILSEKLLFGSEKVIVKRQAELPLRFKSDGTFKILQVADLHYGAGAITRCRDVLPSEFEHCSDLNSTQFLRRMIEEEKPDFVAFTGDNIFGPSTNDAAESLFGAFGPVMLYGIPWAAVLGNHDQESTMNREELMSLISLMDYSVSQINPFPKHALNSSTERIVSGIDGFGNYDLKVHGAPGSGLANITVLNLFFLDSGGRAVVDGIRTYGWIKESQLDWLWSVSHRSEGKKRNNHHKEEISPALDKPPAMAFFHIPIPEVGQLYNKNIVGHFREAVASSVVNSGVMGRLASMGGVKAVFMGHDHNNDFCGNLEGIWFCYGGGFGYHGYGRTGWPRRARVIMAELGKGVMAWKGVEKINTWKRLDDEKLSIVDVQVLWDNTRS